MSLEDRIQWLLLGCLIGLVLGYVARDIRDKISMKRSAEEERAIRMGERHKRNESGMMRGTYLANIMLLLVVLLTAVAAFQSQKASNNVERANREITAIGDCTRVYLDRTITALNERTTYSRAQADANVELQRLQSRFLSVLLVQPPAPIEEFNGALQNYFDALNEFVRLAGKTSQKAAENPYPTEDELDRCIEQNQADD